MDKRMYRAIWSETGKKENGCRPTTLTLGWVDTDDFVHAMTPKEFLESELPYVSNSYSEKELIQKLFKGLRLNQQIEINKQMKVLGEAFEDKLKLLLDSGVKLTKRGVKVGCN